MPAPRPRTPMPDRTFPLFGSEPAPMVGRATLLQRVWADLTKATPSNLTIVGPRSTGKSVLLNALEAKARQQGSSYSIVLKWELGHAPPKSDELFITKLSEQ